MTDPVLAVAPPPSTTTPGTVTAAAVVTIALSALTAGTTMLSIVVFAVLGSSMTSAFEDTTPLVLIAVSALAWSALGVAVSIQLLRRRWWAWRTLLVLSVLRAILALGSGLGVASLVSMGAAVAVLVLLLRASTREWLAAQP